jgi:hypothetical protein
LQAPQPEPEIKNAVMVITVIQEEITIDRQAVEIGKIRSFKRISKREQWGCRK